MQITPEFDQRVQTLLAEFSHHRKSVAPSLLQIAAEEFGGLEDETLTWISSLTDVPEDELAAIAKYLDLLKPQPAARHRILVCTHTHCASAGSKDFLEQIESSLATAAGGSSADGKYELYAVQCLGSCDYAPVIQVNRDQFLGVTAERIADILREMN